MLAIVCVSECGNYSGASTISYYYNNYCYYGRVGNWQLRGHVNNSINFLQETMFMFMYMYIVKTEKPLLASCVPMQKGHKYKLSD